MFSVMISSCAVHSIGEGVNKKNYRNIEGYFKHSKTLQDHLTGFILYNTDLKKVVFNQNSDKYFTPASNTKLLTLYAALEVLGDSIPWMAVTERDDKMVFIPMGDPSYLHPLLPENPRIANYFTTHFNQGDTVHMSIDHFRDFRFGAGWSWDDYMYYYQSEKSVFPIHANAVQIIPSGDEVIHSPDWMDVWSGYTEFNIAYRDEASQVYVLPEDGADTLFMPIITDRDLLFDYFNYLGLHLNVVSVPFELNEVDFIYSMPTKELCQFYVEESDNLIAEQLLLQCSMMKLGYMHTGDIISHLHDNETKRWSSSWNWFDGSGLSRYNLVTPATMLDLVNTLIAEHGFEHIREILPAGGEEGSIEHWYGYDPPRVFAKTGTLKYCHNLSGIIQTKKGHTYTFSFMHNNFNYGSSGVKKAMADVFDLIVELY